MTSMQALAQLVTYPAISRARALLMLSEADGSAGVSEWGDVTLTRHNYLYTITG